VIPDGVRYLVGLIGAEISTSLSPQLHEREADELGLKYFYQLIDIEQLGLDAEAAGPLLSEARRMGFRGLNITHPCKQVVVPHLDGLSPAAAALTAVNTVEFADGKMIGHNTDSSGFEAAFTRGLPQVPLRHVAILGAGGAGAAVAHALLRLGVQRLTIVELDSARAHKLTAALRTQFAPDWVRSVDPGDLATAMGDADGLVNATPVGMEPQTGMPLPEELLRPEMWVADIVYRPLETELLARARARGCQTLSGSGMLVFQAAEAFRLFTGRAPDVGRMFAHLEFLTAPGDRSRGRGAAHLPPDHGGDRHGPAP
jgi:quinate/shikimate dehydrogenase (NAD+)